LHAFETHTQGSAVDPELTQAQLPYAGSLVRSVIMQHLQGHEFTAQRLELTQLLRARLNHDFGVQSVLEKCFEGDEVAISFAVQAAAEAAAY